MLVYYLGPASEIFKDIDLPLIEPAVPAGAPGPPEEYREKRIDLNRLFNFGPSAYTWYAQGDSMTGAGIHTGDVLIVDRAVQAAVGDIVIAEVNRQPTVKRLGQANNRGYLLPENVNHKSIPIDPDEGTRVWGVVTGVFHRFKKK
jgi:DNA polymerase V